jgi:hypothetical protein
MGDQIPELDWYHSLSTHPAVGFDMCFDCGHGRPFGGVYGHNAAANGYTHVDRGKLNAVSTKQEEANYEKALFSIVYLTFHNIIARRQVLGFHDDEPTAYMKRPSYVGTRLLIVVCTMWLITSGANFVVAARQPVCIPGHKILAYWQSGGPCVAQRAGTAISILVL